MRKQIVSRERVTREVSFIGHIIGFHAQTQKLRVGLHKKINSTIEKYC